MIASAAANGPPPNMDISKAVEFVSIHVSDYFLFAGLTLARPGLRFAAPAPSAAGSLIDRAGNSVTQAQLNPKLLTFVTASLIAGSLIANAWPGRPADTADISQIVLIGGLWWILGGVLVHMFCRVLRGRGSLLDTLSVTLQLNAVIFVTCSLIALLVSSVGQADAQSVYYLVSGFLSIVYTPLALRGIHGFGLFRALALAAYVVLVGAVYVIASANMFESTSGRMFIPPPRSRPPVFRR